MASGETASNLQKPSKAAIFSVLVDLSRFLTFRASAADYARFGPAHLAVGMATTWLVGIARNWDYPEANLIARSGLASVIYVFVLSAILWGAAYPVSETKQGYRKVLTVVTMTAAPGLIYGIPVEMMMPLATAQAVNLWFLLIVASWRLALMAHFFTRAAENGPGTTASILLLPIGIIAIALVETGRAGYVIELMGGVRYVTPEVQHRTDDVIALIGCLAWPITPLCLLIWVWVLITHIRNS